MPASGNVGLAFGLVAAAGLSTAIGAAIVFCADMAKPRLLAGSLGFAAGVMLYVSFAEIFMSKSLQGFEDAGYSQVEAYRYGTLAFFGGFLCVAILDRVVHFIVDMATKRAEKLTASQSQVVLLDNEDPPNDNGSSFFARRKKKKSKGCNKNNNNNCSSGCCDDGEEDPTTAPQTMVAVKTEVGGGVLSNIDVEAARGSSPTSPKTSGYGACMCDTDVIQHMQHAQQARHAHLTSSDPIQEESVLEDTDDGTDDGENKKKEEVSTSRETPAVVELMKDDPHAFALKKMGLLTATAIFIHNFPEGLATFVGTLADTSVGIGIAVAIAIHNIPEGICVAMPIYYATGSRWKAFMWALLSGMSEPVGAFIGWLALYDNTSIAFAIVFALVGGMMVYISVKELIPTALKYDPNDTVATTCVIVGMIIMASSLLLFTL